MKRGFVVSGYDELGNFIDGVDNLDKKSWFKPRHAKKHMKKHNPLVVRTETVFREPK